MNAVARGKRDMFEAFVNKELGEGNSSCGHYAHKTNLTFIELETLLKGCIPDILDEDEPSQSTSKQSNPKKSSRKRDSALLPSNPDSTVTPDATISLSVQPTTIAPSDALTALPPSDAHTPISPLDPDTSMFLSDQDESMLPSDPDTALLPSDPAPPGPSFPQPSSSGFIPSFRGGFKSSFEAHSVVRRQIAAAQQTGKLIIFDRWCLTNPRYSDYRQRTSNGSGGRDVAASGADQPQWSRRWYCPRYIFQQIKSGTVQGNYRYLSTIFEWRA